MKKLRSLCAVVSTAMMLYAGAAFGAQQKLQQKFNVPEQKFDVPEYSKEGVEAKVQHYVMGLGAKLTPINNLSEVPGFPTMTVKTYSIDRNDDGKTDLEHKEHKINDSEYYGPTGKKFLFKGYTVIRLIIDDDFDDNMDRVLVDSHDKDLKSGYDLIFDAEQHLLRQK